MFAETGSKAKKASFTMLYSPAKLLITTCLMISSHFILVATGMCTNLLGIMLTNLLFYLIPGYYVVALTTKRKLNAVELLVESFILSLILNNLISAILLVLRIGTHMFILVHYLFILSLALLLFFINNRKSYSVFNKKDGLIIFVHLFSSLLLIYLLLSLNKFLTGDENAYVFLIKRAISYGELIPTGGAYYAHPAVHIINGRLLWTVMLSSYVMLNGGNALMAYLINSLFLPIMGLTGVILLRTIANGKFEFLELLIYILIVTNTSLLFHSSFILNDVVCASLTLIAVYFLMRSLEQMNHEVMFDLSYFLKFVIILTIILLIKANILILLTLYLLYIVYMAKYGVYKSSFSGKVIFYLSLITILCYEFFVDIPFIVAGYFVRNEYVVSLVGKFVVISPLELIIGLFIRSPWHPITVFDLSFYDLMDRFYSTSNVDNVSLPLSSIFLISLLVFKYNKEFWEKIRLKILSISMIASFFIYYILFLFDSLADIRRYSLPVIPLIILLSLMALTELIKSRKWHFVLLAILPSALYLYITHYLLLKRGGVAMFLGLPRQTSMMELLLLQLATYLAVLCVMNVINSKKITVQVKIANRNSKVYIKAQEIIIFALIFAIIICNFSTFSWGIGNSLYLKSRGYDKVAEELHNLYRSEGETIVVTNAYTQIRSYLDESNGILLVPPPVYEDEFIKFLRVAPNNTLVAISLDPNVNYEYANSWIKKYASLDFISINIPREEVMITSKPFLVSFETSSNNSETCFYGGRLVDGMFGKAIELNGVNEYVEVSKPLGEEYSIVLWFKLNDLPSNFTEYGKVLLMKGREPYIELSIGITNDGRISIFANDGSKPVFSLRSNPVINDRAWHQLILTVGDGTKVYFDGMKILESPLKPLLKLREPIRIGSDRPGSPFINFRYFPGLVDELQIYDFALDENDVSSYWYGLRLVESITVNGNLIKIYRLDTKIPSLTSTYTPFTNVNVSLNTNETGVVLSISHEKGMSFIGLIKTIRFSKVIETQLNGTSQYIFPFYEGEEYASRRIGVYLLNFPTLLLYNLNSGEVVFQETLHPIFYLNLSNIYLLLPIIIVQAICFIFTVRFGIKYVS
jgi:hypothetical protein